MLSIAPHETWVYLFGRGAADVPGCVGGSGAPFA